MANPIEPTKISSVTAEEKIEPTRNDPTPEERKGDSRFLPVVIVAGIELAARRARPGQVTDYVASADLERTAEDQELIRSAPGLLTS